MVTGGARSGKSSFSQEKVVEIGKQIGYIATAIPIDADMVDRIAKHQSSRPASWPTFEKYNDFRSLILDERFVKCDTFLLDCMTILITNLMFKENIDYDTCTMEVVNLVEEQICSEIEHLLDFMHEQNKQLVVVTNEVGLGLVPAYRLGNLFRDIAGRMNQLVARRSDEVYLVVSGIPVKIK